LSTVSDSERASNAILIFLRQALIHLQNYLGVPEIPLKQIWPRMVLRILLPILFPISQRGHGDFGVFRAGMMHRFAFVPKVRKQLSCK
jgi:hypothetical protein